MKGRQSTMFSTIIHSETYPIKFATFSWTWHCILWLPKLAWTRNMHIIVSSSPNALSAGRHSTLHVPDLIGKRYLVMRRRFYSLLSEVYILKGTFIRKGMTGMKNTTTSQPSTAPPPSHLTGQGCHPAPIDFFAIAQNTPMIESWILAYLTFDSSRILWHQPHFQVRSGHWPMTS